MGETDALSPLTSDGGSPREQATTASAIIGAGQRPGLGGFMSFVLRLTLLTSAAVVLACEEPPAQGPNEWTYQNGYPQTTTQAGPTARPAVTYSPLATATTAPTASSDTQAPPLDTQGPTQIQLTPVPLGVPTSPPPAPTAQTPLTYAPTSSDPSPAPSMAVPGRGAGVCSSDAMCGLSKCNTGYGRCAYPCKSSETDCKAGNLCSKGGVCLLRMSGGVSMWRPRRSR